MGAAIIGALLSRSALAARVAALVWDAPLVDWRATLRQQARIRHLPPALTEVTTRVAGRRIGIDFDRFDLMRPPARGPAADAGHPHDGRQRGARGAQPKRSPPSPPSWAGR